MQQATWNFYVGIPSNDVKVVQQTGQRQTKANKVSCINKEDTAAFPLSLALVMQFFYKIDPSIFSFGTTHQDIFGHCQRTSCLFSDFHIIMKISYFLFFFFPDNMAEEEWNYSTRDFFCYHTSFSKGNEEFTLSSGLIQCIHQWRKGFWQNIHLKITLLYPYPWKIT